MHDNTACCYINLLKGKNFHEEAWAGGEPDVTLSKKPESCDQSNRI